MKLQETNTTTLWKVFSPEFCIIIKTNISSMPALEEMDHQYFPKKTDGGLSMDWEQHGTFPKKTS